MGKALFELGPSQLSLYGLYRLGLRSGFFRWQTSLVEPLSEQSAKIYALRQVFTFPDSEQLMRVLGEAGYQELLIQADEIVAGQVRLFSGEPQPLKLAPPDPLQHWTAYELGSTSSTELDVKYIWEPARFGWAYSLGRAYYLSGDARYADAFWKYSLEFLDANPPYMGLNWVSAQEVALRLIALVFAAQIFADSPHSSQARMNQLGWSIACHARRIPPTLIYARAQNNNHLLSEAAGLYTAGLALSEHPESEDWQSVGWRWFNQGLQSQIQPEGTYIQHSANYQRLMLQLALWVAAIAKKRNMILLSAGREKLRAATGWLLTMLDSQDGRVPNLGPNDGAYILPLTVCAFNDYRPVLQAAARAFAGSSAVTAGQWDEMSAWLVPGIKGLDQSGGGSHFQRPSGLDKPLVLRNHRNNTWAYLRAAHFTSRPGHADQLHLDLWWRGMNIAQDAGTYRYNASKPWDNALTRTAVHNTVTVNNQDQMLPAGRFLWLDWADSRVITQSQEAGKDIVRLVAEHNGYRHIGITHRRSVTTQKEGDWLIEDALIFADPTRVSRYLPLPVRLHWLVPDWNWSIDQDEGKIAFGLESPYGQIELMIWLDEKGDSQLQLIPSIVRAGEELCGSDEGQPTWGWVSHTYGMKIPALSLSVRTTTTEPIKLISEWHIP